MTDTQINMVKALLMGMGFHPFTELRNGVSYLTVPAEERAALAAKIEDGAKGMFRHTSGETQLDLWPVVRPLAAKWLLPVCAGIFGLGMLSTKLPDLIKKVSGKLK